MAEMRSFGRVTERKIALLFNSHYHEDYGVGNSLFPDAPLHLHTLDAPALRSLGTLFEYYDAVEKNSVLLHLRKLIREGRVEWDGERYLRS